MRIFFAVFRKIIIFAHWYSAFCWICGRTLRGCVDWNLCIKGNFRIINCRTLRGCVDWNKLKFEQFYQPECRTLRGCVDWNTQVIKWNRWQRLSHPTWVRGLKPQHKYAVLTIRMSHPTWVRGLKHSASSTTTWTSGRTLRGCVDWNTLLRRDRGD